MSNLISINISAGAAGKTASGKKAGDKGQAADLLFANQIANTGGEKTGKTNKSIKSDKISLSSQSQNIANVKKPFAEKLKRFLAAAPGPDGMGIDLKINQPVFQTQKLDSRSPIAVGDKLCGNDNGNGNDNPPRGWGLNKINEQILIKTVDSNLIKKETNNALSTETANILTRNSEAIPTPPSENGNLSAVSKKSAVPTGSDIGQEPFFTKSDAAGSALNKKDTQEIFKNYAGANRGKFQNRSAVKPTDTSPTTSDIQTKKPDSRFRGNDKYLFPQAAAAAKDPTFTKPFEQNFSAKQTPDKANQKTVSAHTQSVSLDDKSSDDLHTLSIQEIKSAVGAERISSSPAPGLKTEIQQAAGDISKQIADSISSAANNTVKQVTIRLNPPELGRVVIKVSEHNSQIDTVLEASNPETKTRLQEAFSQVAKNLADAGITLRQFEVRSVEQPRSDFESAFSQSSQSGQSDNGSAERFFQSQNPADSSFYYPEQTFSLKKLSSEENFSQNHFSARSVNMLA